VNFDRLADTGFGLEHTLRTGVQELADQFTTDHHTPATRTSQS
jgi:UDP-glucose 4-epimerase